MPVEVPSIHGQIPYDVERVIRDTAGAVNKLEQSSSQQAVLALRQEIGNVAAGLDSLTQRVDDLLRRVRALENP